MKKKTPAAKPELKTVTSVTNVIYVRPTFLSSSECPECNEINFVEISEGQKGQKILHPCAACDQEYIIEISNLYNY